MSIKIRERQTIFDVALQACGSAESAFNIARLNDVSVSEMLPSGTSLELPDIDAVGKRVVAYYSNNAFYPATGE